MQCTRLHTLELHARTSIALDLAALLAACPRLRRLVVWSVRTLAGAPVPASAQLRSLSLQYCTADPDSALEVCGAMTSLTALVRQQPMLLMPVVTLAQDLNHSSGPVSKLACDLTRSELQEARAPRCWLCVRWSHGLFSSRLGF
jgi:hypothetical protein